MVLIGQTFFPTWIVILCSVSITFASKGDRSGRFQQCLHNCQQDCQGTSYPAYLPLYLLVFGWGCEDECKYVCMHKVTEDALVRGQDIQQFYGKVNNCYLVLTWYDCKYN